jgi:hypothetical protein
MCGIVMATGIVLLFLLSACAQEADPPQESVDLLIDDASQDVVSEVAGVQSEQSAKPEESGNTNLPEPEFIPKDMHAFFGIPDEEVFDSKTYYIQYTEWIKVNDYYLDTPVIAIWEAGTNRVTIDRMLAKNLVSAIEKKYNYKNDKMPYVGAENPDWYHPRIIARISDDKETVMLYQPSIEYYYDYSEKGTDESLAAEFTPTSYIFLNKAFVHKDKRIVISYIDSDCKGYVWRLSEETSADGSTDQHYDILTDTNVCVDFDSFFSANACSDDLTLAAFAGSGIWIYDESGKEIMNHNFKRGGVDILEFTGNNILYLWDDGNTQPIYYLYDFSTGMTKAYKERFDVSIAERQFSLFGGYKITGRYFTTIKDKTLKICDRITGKVTEIYSDEFGEGVSWSETIVMDENFVSSFIDLDK